MLLMPAIDLKGGRCVRLLQGRRQEETVYGEDPVEMARHWEQQGAPWLHVVDLDGAFTGQPVHLEVVQEIAGAVSVPIQMGGGIRTLEEVEKAFSRGVSRVIVGTAAARDRDFLASLAHNWARDIAVSIDVRGGQLAVSGWEETAEQTPAQFLLLLQELGLYNIICTDVSRDGTLAGTDPLFLEPFLDQGLQVYLAGGVRALQDIEAALPLERRGLRGIILGRALYAGTLDLVQALALVNHSNPQGE